MGGHAADLQADDAVLRRRPDPDTWSAIEYALHVAGVFTVFATRVRRVRLEDDPELGWWDHEASVTEERYGERSAEEARAAIADGAVALALALPRLDVPTAGCGRGRGARASASPSRSWPGTRCTSRPITGSTPASPLEPAERRSSVVADPG